MGWGLGFGIRTTDLDRSLELEEDRLVDEYFASFCTQVFDFVFCELDWLARSVATHCKRNGTRQNVSRRSLQLVKDMDGRVWRSTEAAQSGSSIVAVR